MTNKNDILNNGIENLFQFLEKIDFVLPGQILTMEDYRLNLEFGIDVSDEEKDQNSDYNYYVDFSDDYVYVNDDIEKEVFGHLFSANTLQTIVENILTDEETERLFAEISKLMEA